MVRSTISQTTCLVVALMLPVCGAGLHAQDAKAGLCFEELIQRNWCELEQIYRQARPGAVPVGFAKGHVIYCPGDFLAESKGRMASLLWHGKHFCSDGTLVNQWLGVRAIRAKVYYGTSWIDGQPAIILDYAGMSHVWHDVRDEMREVAPGLYVGAMYKGHCPELKVYFVLQTTCCCK